MAQAGPAHAARRDGDALGSRGAVAVTGANRGIGAAVARELARRGWDVACLTRSGAAPSTDGLDEAAASRIRSYRCDIADAFSIAPALAAAAADAGGLAGLVNNAGILAQGPSESFPLDQFRSVLEVNVTGSFAAAQAAFPHLSGKGGIIVNLGSFYERIGAKRFAAYAASKAAIAALTRVLAAEWARHGIWVYNVAPGLTATDMNAEERKSEQFNEWLRRRIPVGRPGEPDEIARLIAVLFCENIGFLTGETITIDGGQSINL